MTCDTYLIAGRVQWRPSVPVFSVHHQLFALFRPHLCENFDYFGPVELGTVVQRGGSLAIGCVHICDPMYYICNRVCIVCISICISYVLVYVLVYILVYVLVYILVYM
jgi:hypothetical protein